MVPWSVATEVVDVGGGVRRFCNPLLVGPPPPFPAFVVEPSAGTEYAPAEPDAVPEFASVGGRHLVRVGAAVGCDRYGLGEVCGPLRHDNRRVTGFTADAFAYDDRRDNLYQAHPWTLCVRRDGTAFGVIVETTYRFTAHCFDILLIEVDGPPPAVTVVEGDDPASVLGRLGALCGTSPLPPRWALGFQQSRWSYAPADEVLETAAEFRDRDLPADVIWVDIDYMDGYRVFTFDPVGFPEPAKVTGQLHDMGWRSAWMIDPGVKIESGYRVYDEAVAGDHLLRTADGEEYHGVVWPGPTVWPDFTRAATRDWWAGLYDEFLATGIDAVWNDMNEPATLETVPDKALPDDVAHDADADLGGPGPHARYRNIYGMQMTRASRAGMEAARPDRRPFLLTRSTFLGGHRYAATWTGDNVSSWEHLAWSIPMALNLGLSGQAMAGPDIGGFAGTCTGPLLARWMGIGCLFPFARNHNMKGMPPQEPWAFGPEVEATCRRALERRYRLLPYLYTLAREAAETGVPIMRPAFFVDPADPDLRDVDTSFLLGDDLYVRGDVSEHRSGPTAPVPADWTRVAVLADGDDDPDLPELYLRPGAVLPLGPVMQWSDERPVDELELVVHVDESGTARGALYEDAGDGHDHAAGEFRLTEFVDDGQRTTTAVVDGDWPGGSWSLTQRRIG